jgi:CHAT domain-containing protein
VLDELRTRDWAHFACHGIVDMLDPQASRLLLRDHLERPLTVRDIATVGAEHGQLAFLSACSTSHTAARLADETISLSSAFLVGGYPRVVATLWPLLDARAVEVSSAVYSAVMAADSFDAAAPGLHAAVRTIRDRRAAYPSGWAGHVYSGA